MEIKQIFNIGRKSRLTNKGGDIKHIGYRLMLNWIRTFFKKDITNQVLFFTDQAFDLIVSKLATLPPETAFLFQVARDKKGRGLVQVGFDNPKLLPSGITKEVILFKGIKLCFTNNSKEILEGCGVDSDSKGNILVYPRIDLEAIESPNKQILIFESNKKFLSDKSNLSYGAWSRDETVNKPILIDSLFKMKSIESIYVEKFKIQIELKKSLSWKNYEEKVSDKIIEYFETLPQPMKIYSKDS